MGKYDVSMKPRFGAMRITSAVAMSKPSPSISGGEPASRSIDHPTNLKPLLESPRDEESPAWRAVNASRSRKWAKDLRVRWRDQLAEEVGADQWGTPRNKQPKVTAEEVPDKDALLPSPQACPLPKPTKQNPSNHTLTAGHNGVQAEPLGYYRGLYVEEFPVLSAGAPILNKRASPPDLDAYMRRCGPMADLDHFEAAELLMTSGLSNADKDRHLKSKRYVGNTPWPDVDAMLIDVDKLAHGPNFQLGEIDIKGPKPRTQYLVWRNIVEIIRDFLSRAEFKDHVRYTPCRLYTSASKTERVYADMAASNWWWRELEKLIARGHRNATIVPLIIATNQTTLSIMCGGQKAYPVYIMFGNLDKEWRRKSGKHSAYLLGYLPVNAFEDVADDTERRRLKAELVHRSMEKMLEPLRVASEEGVEMWCPDGQLRRIYPCVAAYTADWPEQNLQCCRSEGGCPICKTPHGDRGNLDSEIELREREETLTALCTYILTKNKIHLDDLGLKPVWPWWGDLPDVNLSACITPDLLHQAHQGVFKVHLIRWAKEIIGADVLNDWFAAMPHAEGLTRYPKGLSAVNSGRWTGCESKQLIAQFLPTVVAGLTSTLAQLVCSLVDFIYRAHAASLTESDLDEMDSDLGTFHQLKQHLVDSEKIYQSGQHFNKIAKLHMLRHWTHSIWELSTPDGYNTEGPEHLHIEFAKVPWRASNKVKPLEQMVTYIQRQEAIRMHRAYLDRYLAGKRDSNTNDLDDAGDPNDRTLKPLVTPRLRDNMEDRRMGSEGEVQPSENTGDGAQDVVGNPNLVTEPVYYPDPVRQMAVKPTVSKLLIQDLVDRYHASNIISDITGFLKRRCGVNGAKVSTRNYVDVWHKLTLHHPAPSFAPFDPIRRDVIRASVPTNRARNQESSAWDIALYLEKPNCLRPLKGEKHGLERYHAGRVHAFFTLPAHIRFFYPGQLAYLELFTPFDASYPSNTKLYSIKPALDSRDLRRTLVVPVSEIFFACHLVPKFDELDPELELNAYTDLLSFGDDFWLNHYYNHHFFLLIQHWRRRRPGIRNRLIQQLQSRPHNLDPTAANGPPTGETSSTPA